jgi:predicted Ser/Thr protein kinase
MNASRNCPRCGASIPAESPAGLCPQCLLQAGLESGTGVDPASQPFQPTIDSPRSGHRFVPLTPEEVGQKLPQLEVLELIDKGGMGAVYKARQRGLDRVVAVKVLSPEVCGDPTFASRFTREAQALGRLNHPHIVTVYDFGQVDGFFYFVMEYVDGVTLREALRTGSMSPAEALAIVPQICEALQYAHDEGIVHRDIKPENILLDRRGRVKIADFGLAKLLGADPAELSLTGTHQVMGTLRYMAPEQMEGSSQVDHRADIYSLGVVFYELLTGELPMGRFAPPSKKVQIDVRLDEVVLRALEREPQQRYQQVSEVKTSVEAIYRASPAALQNAFGREYRSTTTLFGLPLVHIATGIDPQTGRKRVAKGIIAIGDMAVGVVAIGGAAAGGIAFGGASLGIISFGGISVGLLLAVGGCAIGGFASGGLAIGGVALGGLALGYYAFGGGAVGVYTMSGAGSHPEAERFFEPWAYQWDQWLTLMAISFPAVFTTLWGVLWLVFYRQHANEHRSAIESSIPREESRRTLRPARRPWGVPIWATLNIAGGLMLMLLASAESITEYSDPFWTMWERVDMIVSFIMAAVLFLASIGLYLWHPWARKAIVGICVVGLIWFVVDIPFLTRAVIPDFASTMMTDLAPVADPQDAPTKEDLEFAAYAFAASLVIPVMLLWLVWMIAQLIYFTRPHVVAGFDGDDDPPASGSGEQAVRSSRIDAALASAAGRWLAKAVATIVYVACLIFFFSFQGAQTASPEGEGKVTTMSVGQPSPWMELRATSSSHRLSFHILSWSVLIAAVGVGALALYRHLESLERGQAHSMWWHYGAWTLMFLVVFGLAASSLIAAYHPREPVAERLPLMHVPPNFSSPACVYMAA